MTEYRQCKRCVMDNAGDPTITFDDNGYCNYCNDALKAKSIVCHPNAEGASYLDKTFRELKKRRQNYKYDCMLGLSGGLDSSYAAYIVSRYDLRILAVHIDDGLDARVTINNVNRICRAYGIDLVMEHPDAKLFGDLTCSFIRAGVPNIAIPQDNVLFAVLYKYARENNIDCFINGSNFALESILQKGNTYDASDEVHIRDIWNRFGNVNDKSNLPLMSVFKKRIYYGYLHKIDTIKPLNYVEYNMKNAFDVLHKTCGFEYYGDKHCESIFTKLMQRYYLPVKFGVDKRKSHYSSMIVSGQMSREEAIARLKEPLYDESQLNDDIEYVLQKIGMNRNEFNDILRQKPILHSHYAMSTVNRLFSFVLKLRKILIKY